VTALREAASLPPLPGASTQRYLDAAADLGEHAVARLWADGLQLTSSAAAQLALDDPDAQPAAGQAARPPEPPAQVPFSPPSPPRPGAAGHDLAASKLTAREREVVELIALGKSNKAIAEQLFISPATAARHVANILAKLGFTSRSQVAAWTAAAGRDLGSASSWPASSGQTGR